MHYIKYSFLQKYWSVVLICFLWLVFCLPYFSQHKIPYPSTYQVNFFSPWSRYPEYGQYASQVKNNAMPDIIGQIYPWKKFSIDQLKQGSLPFWNPYSFSGTPHIANYQSAVFSPFTLLYFLLPFIDAWSISILVQPLMAGIFTYIYLRKVEVSTIGATLGSISFMFSGFMVVWMAYGTLGMALAVLPAILFSIEGLFGKKVSLLHFLGISFGITFSLVSGHFQTSFYVLLVSFLYFLFKGYLTREYKKLLWGGYSFGIGILLAMPQLLPSLEFFQNAPRSVSSVASAGIPFYNLITIFAPDFFGNPVTRNNMFLDFAEWQAFIGTIPFLLSFFVIVLAKKNRLALFFFGVGLASLILATATPLQDIIGGLHIPVISTSAQSRIISIFSFCFALLGGFGFDAVSLLIKQKKYKHIFSMLLIMFLAILSIWGVLQFGKFLDPVHTQVAKKNFIIPSLVMLIGIIGIGFSSLFPRKQLKLGVAVLLLLLTSFESFRYAAKWMPFDPASLVFPESKVANYLIQNIGTGRIYGNLGQEMTMYYGLGAVEGYDPLYIQRYGEFVVSENMGTFLPTGGRTVFLEKTNKNTDRVLNILGVTHIFHPISDTNAEWAYPVWKKPWMKSVYIDGSYELFKNEQALPRAKMFYSTQSVSHDKDIITSFYQHTFDYRNTLLLEGKNGITKREEAKNTVKITSFQPNTIKMTVSTDAEGLLFLSNAYYPGWKAYVDNTETTIQRANYAFQAISVPKGTHSVMFSYFPTSFLYGVILAVLGLVMIPLLFLLRKRF